MSLPFPFDFKNPDYRMVVEWRLERLARIRKNPTVIPAIKVYYRDNPIQCIIDWGCTFDPRNVDVGLPAVMPFLPFPRQEEWLYWVLDCWKKRSNGLTDKSRGVGVSWLAVALSSVLCIFNHDMVIGFGSRKQEYVDKKGNPKSLFAKGRQFISLLPHEFRAGCDINKHAPELRIMFPETNSLMEGESGDNIGRGDRTTIYFKDESAWYEHPEIIEAALVETTNCSIDISTPRTRKDVFGQKRFSGRVPVFSFHYRDDPRKDADWEEKKRAATDPIIFEIEYNLNYDAGIDNNLIPYEWAVAIIDAHVKLGIAPLGKRKMAFDVADEGSDLNAMCAGKSFLITFLKDFPGVNSTIYQSVEEVYKTCDFFGITELHYDADGLGAGVRGDAENINKSRIRKIEVIPFKGSYGVVDPEKEMIEGRPNEDYFQNYNAQSWYALRMRVFKTFHALELKRKGQPVNINPDEIISISGELKNIDKIISELTQPLFSFNDAGLMLIDKKPKGTKSPNLADAIKIYFAPTRQRKSIFDD